MNRALLSVRALAAIATAFALCACGAAQQESETPASAASAPPPVVELSPLPPGHLWRYEVMKVMSPGLGAFLQRVDVRETMVDSKFHGWQILALRGELAFWDGVDLRNGDVITRVNGQPIGHYDEAYRVWTSLGTAPELVVSYERGQEARELRFVIHDEQEAKDGRPGAGAAAPAKPKPAGAQPPTAPAATPGPAPAAAPPPAKTPNPAAPGKT